MRIKHATTHEGKPAYQFMCPGCRTVHTLVAGRFSGTMDRPTFDGSVGFTWRRGWCHSYVRDGKIEFLIDSYHDLKGQTVDLPELLPDGRFPILDECDWEE